MSAPAIPKMGGPTSAGGTTPPASPGEAPPQQSSSTAGNDNNKSMHAKGRSKIPWPDSVWQRLDQAVEMEVKRTRIGGRFLPKRPVPPKTTSVPTDSYTLPTPANPILSVDEGATTRLCEYYVEYEMTPQQVEQEEGDFKELGHSTAVTLATKAANTLALAEDLIIFQGQNATTAAAPFVSGFVLTLNNAVPSDTGLLDFAIGANAPGGAPPLVPAPTVIQVQSLVQSGNPTPGVIWGSNTFEQVAAAYSALQLAGHYGPYALVLETIPYADTYAPFPATLTLTADRIKPLMTAGFFGTGTLPPNPANPPAPLVQPFYGVMVSLGGNTMDLVMGLEPLVAFMQEDTNGNFRFRVLQRFALRIKDTTGIIVLQFTQAAGEKP